MSAGPYLVRRGAALVFRRRVPKISAHRMRSAFLQFPLGTHLLPEGRRRALRASAFLDAAFGYLEAGMVICDLDGETIERVVLSLARFELDVREDLRALAPPRGPAEVEAALRLEAATRETLRAALVYNDYAAVRTPVASTLGRLGVEVREESPCWRALARAAARALIEVSDENARREQGRYAGTMLSRLDTAPHALPVDIRTLPP